jgi:glutamate-1-semialdehyde 2,1-aminomutase
MVVISREQMYERYRKSSPISGDLYQQGAEVLLGGTTRTSVYFEPYPLYMQRGVGACVWDEDGVKRLDFLNNYTSLIHGHSFGPVVEAVRTQAQLGLCYGAPTKGEIELAKILVELVPSVQKLRFCSSGTEAVMYALRLAKAYTGRDKVAKFEGGFHGAHESVQFSFGVGLDYSENLDPIPTSAGIPASWAEDVIVLPFNDQKAAEDLIRRHHQDLAAVIIEPIMGSGGVIPATREFLSSLRAITEEYGIVLIFDEIMSLRTAPGGVQAQCGILPDLTTMGKIISGGLPLAAFGGREDIMALLDPRGKDPLIPHSGTFNGTVLAAVAGAAAMSHLTPETYTRLNDLAASIAQGMERLFKGLNIPGTVTVGGSLFNVHFTDREITTFRDVLTGDMDKRSRFFFGMLHRGVFLASRGMGCISTPMTEAEVAAFLEAAEATLIEDILEE